jgi:CRISPR-associated endonuclease/helicase Cas3
MDAVGQNMMKQSMANLNALKLNKGYTRSSGDWDEESRIPTRLTEQETFSGKKPAGIFLKPCSR